jgi:hypothetical protein
LANAETRHPATEPPATRKRTPRSAGWDDPELFMPTLQDLERQARRRPVGRTVLDICLDLAVVPGLCHSAFWNELFDTMTCFGGSIDKLMRQKSRRWQAFPSSRTARPPAPGIGCI